MKVNFIVTAHDKEIYFPYLLKIITRYRKVEPEIVIAYNGSDPEFSCTVRRPPMPGSDGDSDLTMSGYNHFKTINDGFRFIKIGVDTFLLDEDILVHIFEVMEQEKACYAGNKWHGNDSESLATDIMFLDTRFGNPLNPPHGMEKDGADFEKWMWQSIRHRKLKWLTIQQREPVHPNNRMECAALKWTMHHQLEKNIENMRAWDYGHLI
jgi:hypothetical protein